MQNTPPGGRREHFESRPAEPLQRIQQQAEAKPAAAQREGQEPSGGSVAQNRPKGGESVLIVDDLPEQTTLARRILERAGFVVLTAETGGEALLVLDNLEGAVDLLITDLRMPGMKGPDLADEARKRYPDLRVLFVSGGNPEGALPSGASFLAKPYAPRELVESARNTLDSKP